METIRFVEFCGNRKVNRGVRLRLDHKYLNNGIKREHLQLPTVDRIAGKMKAEMFYSSFGTTSGFWHLELHAESTDVAF